MEEMITSELIEISYPSDKVSRIEVFLHMYSTVGDLEPTCLRSKLLKMRATSFFA
jgi:hypothetical protein